MTTEGMVKEGAIILFKRTVTYQNVVHQCFSHCCVIGHNCTLVPALKPSGSIVHVAMLTKHGNQPCLLRKPFSKSIQHVIWSEIWQRIRKSILTKILVNKIVRILRDSCKYYSFLYKVKWREFIDSCKIPFGDSNRF